jgi:hypothetical protein
MTVIRELGEIRADVGVNESLPSARAGTAMAVNCFETDAAWKIEAGVIGTSASRLAEPYPAS